MMAGSWTSSTSRPPSTSRATCIVFLSARSLRPGFFAFSSADSSDCFLAAKVACPHTRYSARSWPVTLSSTSTACLPIRTTSGFSLSITFWRRRATGPLSREPSWFTKIPRSAPLAHAGRVSPPPDAHPPPFRRRVRVAQPEPFLDPDLVEGIGAVVHALGDDPGAVRLHLDLRLVVLDPFDRDQDLQDGPPSAGRSPRTSHSAT